jgi:integrase
MLVSSGFCWYMCWYSPYQQNRYQQSRYQQHFFEDIAMPLTDVTVKNAKPAGRPFKLTDEKGLHLLITPAGGRLWRMAYRFNGKQKTLALGAYPDVSLRSAREGRDEARKLLTTRVDPGEVKRAQKAAQQERSANTFGAVAERWLEKWETEVADSTAKSQRERLQKHIMPILGPLLVADIDAQRILVALKPLEERGSGDTLRKSKTAISMIMRFAIQRGWAKVDPVPSLRGAFRTGPVKHMAAILDPARVGQLLRDIDGYRGQPPVCAALRLLPLVFVRPGELRSARWKDIDLDAAEWKYFITKTKTEHLVPLARQTVAILEELRPLTGQDRHGFVFPGLRPGKPISNNTLNAALRGLGYSADEVVGHGFRASARMLLAKKLNFPPEIIEHQLGHRVADSLGTAYNRTKFLPQRRKMMQTWADYLDALRAGAEIVSLHGQAA